MAERDEFTAFVLAGGKSTRMGTDKAFLELGGQPLIAHAMALGRSVAARTKIVGDPTKFGSLGDVVPDVYAVRGPLGGIHAALVASDTDRNLVLGVDLPFIQPRFLEFLIAESLLRDALVTVPFASGHLQPLCAVYRKPFLAAAEHALAHGRNKVDALFSEVQTRVINEQELVVAGFPTSMFRNLNTPGDWELARKELESRPQHL